MMAFPAMARILIGGATEKASVFNVVPGVILFQCLLTLATPVANAVINVKYLSPEVVRYHCPERHHPVRIDQN